MSIEGHAVVTSRLPDQSCPATQIPSNLSLSKSFQQVFANCKPSLLVKNSLNLHHTYYDYGNSNN